MDIVSRLKQFIDRLGVPVTQFADNCGIPRPTLSQLLNGRNKTVRDELISKIHDAYPQLSVMWLMFGEGEQLVDDRQATSATQPVREYADSTALPFDDDDSRDDQCNDRQATDTRSMPIDFSIDMAPRHDNGANLTPEEIAAGHDSGNVDTLDQTVRNMQPRTISFGAEAEAGKRIVNIIVYYSDNSFQSFIPDPNPRSPFPM